MVPVLEPLIVPVAEPVIVPVLDPVIVPTLFVREPVIVPAKVGVERDIISAARAKVKWVRFICFLLVDLRLLGLAKGKLDLAISFPFRL